MRSSSVYPLFVAITLPWCSGCDSSQATATVTGEVTYQGSPAAGASIRFYGPGGKPVNTAIIRDDGSYVATAALGENTVTILPRYVSDSGQGELAPDAKLTKQPDIPDHYTNFSWSSLRCNVTQDGDNTFDVDL